MDGELGNTFGEELYDYFEQEYRDSMLPNEVAKIGTWTKRMLSILEGMGKKLGYSVSIEKPIRVDMAWFDRRYFEPQIVIEYESDKKGVLDSELLNLAYSSARLKVLITFIEEREIEYFLSEITRRWKTRSARVWNDELLVIFCIYTLETGKRFQYFIGHLFYFLEAKLVTKELKQILA